MKFLYNLLERLELQFLNVVRAICYAWSNGFFKQVLGKDLKKLQKEVSDTEDDGITAADHDRVSEAANKDDKATFNILNDLFAVQAIGSLQRQVRLNLLSQV